MKEDKEMNQKKIKCTHGDGMLMTRQDSYTHDGDRTFTPNCYVGGRWKFEK